MIFGANGGIGVVSRLVVAGAVVAAAGMLAACGSSHAGHAPSEPTAARQTSSASGSPSASVHGSVAPPTSGAALPDPAQPDLLMRMPGSLVFNDSGTGTARLDLSHYVDVGKTIGVRIVCGGGGPRFTITASTSRLLSSGGCDVTPYGYSKVAGADDRVLTLHAAADQHWRVAVWAG